MSEALVESLLRLVQAAGVNTPLVFGVIARVSAIVFLAPGLGERVVPVRVRLAAVFAMTVLVAPPLMSSAAPQTVSPSQLAALIGAESFAGLIIGFSLRLAIFILQMIGTIAAQHLSMSMLFGPGLGHEQESPLSTILIMAGIAAAASGGLHVEVAASLIRSYHLFPFGVAAFRRRRRRVGDKKWRPSHRLGFRLGGAFRDAWFCLHLGARSDESRHASSDGGVCRRAGDHLRRIGAFRRIGFNHCRLLDRNCQRSRL